MKINRDALYLGVIGLLISATFQSYYTYQYKPEAARSVHVYYNRDIQINKELVSRIQEADHFVYFAVYTFTRKDLQDALLGAKHRGLDVKGVTDAGQSTNLETQKKVIAQLESAGIPVVVQDHLGLMHIKLLVTDKAYASGSYNWTSSATNLNDEVIEIGYDEGIRTQYGKVFLEVFNKYKK